MASDKSDGDDKPVGISPSLMNQNSMNTAARVTRMRREAEQAQFAAANNPNLMNLMAAALLVEIVEPLPANHPTYALVGRIASEWAHFEAILDQIIWMLSGLDGPTGASITAQMMGSGNRLVTIRTLADEKGVLSALDNRLTALEKCTLEPQEARNRVVHDPWFWEKNSKVVKQHRSKPKKERVFGLVPRNEDDLKNLINDIAKLTQRARDFHELVKQTLVGPKPSPNKP